MARATPKVLNTTDTSKKTASRQPGGERSEGDPTALYELTAEERRARIAEVAYGIAERRGFAPGSEDKDWLEAEREVDAHKPPNQVV